MKVESSRNAPRRVVVDTNVWISAALSRQGSPARLVLQVLARELPVFSPATFAELESRLWQPKFDRFLSLELRQRILHDLSAAAHWVEVPPKIASQRYCRDPDDDKFIHAAVTAQAPWLVTGDHDLLAVPAMTGLRILAPAAALRLRAFGGSGR